MVCFITIRAILLDCLRGIAGRHDLLHGHTVAQCLADGIPHDSLCNNKIMLALNASDLVVKELRLLPHRPRSCNEAPVNKILDTWNAKLELFGHRNVMVDHVNLNKRNNNRM